MTVRGGGVPACVMAFVPRKRMGPPPRSFAADAHDCIMVWVLEPTEYKVVARLIRAPERGLPIGDGIMSAIDFDLAMERLPHPKGDRVKIGMSGKFLPYKYYGNSGNIP